MSLFIWALIFTVIGLTLILCSVIPQRNKRNRLRAPLPHVTDTVEQRYMKALRRMP
jgi:hypothetical protein